MKVSTMNNERKTKRQLIEELVKMQKRIRELKGLSGVLPICCSCKKIRDDDGYWHHVETYLRDHSEVKFSHGICPECAKTVRKKFKIEE